MIGAYKQKYPKKRSFIFIAAFKTTSRYLDDFLNKDGQDILLPIMDHNMVYNLHAILSLQLS